MNTWLEVYAEFEQLRKALEVAGFSVAHNEHENYAELLISGNNIKAAACTPNNETYTSLNGRLSADHKDCFNKWSQCPLVVEIPTDLNILIEHLKFLGSKEGFQLSNSFDYLDCGTLPYELND